MVERSPLACASIYKKCLVPSAIALLVLMGCGIPHDNPLDPANPGSSRTKKIMIEAFVNLQPGPPSDVCGFMVDALDSLASLYPDRVVIAEYHRNAQNYPTPLHLAENEILYQHYWNALDSSSRGVRGMPDVFINGTEARVQGASDKASAFFRLQQAVTARESEIGRYTIEVGATVSGNRVTPQVTIARLGNSDVENLLVRAVLVSRISSPRFTRVVSGAVTGTVIGRLNRGQIMKITLPSLQSDASVPRELIACVCDRDQKTIYQVEKARISP
jgi:hypothetical protein